MAKIIPNDEKVFMVSKSTNTIYSGSAALKAMNEWYTMEDVVNTVRPYKVFTALLTQSGGDGPSSINSGELVIGRTYTIANGLGRGYDFTNVGAPNNDWLTTFIATGTTPDWGEGNPGLATLYFNTGAPVATVLENTIGNIWFTYGGSGWFANSDNLFLNGKVFVNSYSYYNTDKDSFITCGVDIDKGTSVSSLRYINVDNNAETREAYNTPIEIRVYN